MGKEQRRGEQPTLTRAHEGANISFLHARSQRREIVLVKILEADVPVITRGVAPLLHRVRGEVLRRCHHPLVARVVALQPLDEGHPELASQGRVLAVRLAACDWARGSGAQGGAPGANCHGVAHLGPIERP